MIVNQDNSAMPFVSMRCFVTYDILFEGAYVSIYNSECNAQSTMEHKKC